MDNFYCSECQECQRILKAKINALKAFLSNFQWLSKAYVSVSQLGQALLALGTPE